VAEWCKCEVDIALSLIFAVFLTNPSPIYVLDEVDAPLDGANLDAILPIRHGRGGGHLRHLATSTTSAV